MLPKFEEEARVWHQTIFQAELVDVTKSCNEDLVDVDGIFYESLITEMVAPTHHSNSWKWDFYLTQIGTLMTICKIFRESCERT